MPVQLGRAVLVAVLVVFGVPATANAVDPTGTWLTQDKDARIKVARCGNAMCGTVVWLKDPIDPKTGKPQVDDKNPDPKLQNRKIMGLQIFALTPKDPGTWAGEIYNADDGRKYDAKISVPGTGKLEVQGCAGPFCGSEIWTKTK